MGNCPLKFRLQQFADWRPNAAIAFLRPGVVLVLACVGLTGTGHAQGTIALNNSGSQSFAFDPVHHYLYSAQQGPGSVRLNVISTLTNTVLGSVTFTAGYAAQTSASGTTVFVPDQGNSMVRVFSVNGSGVPSSLRNDSATLATGSAALTTTYAVTKQGTGDHLDINSVASGATQHSPLIGSSAGNVYADANTGQYYADYSSGCKVIAESSGAEIRSLGVQVVAVDSASAHNFVYTAAGTVLTQLSGATNSQTANYDFGVGFTVGAVAINSANGDVFVAIPSQNKVVELTSSLVYVREFSATTPVAIAFADGQLFIDPSGASSLTAIVVDPPVITAAPSNQTVTAGGGASFTVTAIGGPSLTYQWYLDSSAISGATSATYTIATTQGSDAGSYTVAVGNTVGSTTSSEATLTVNVPPSITTQPTDQTVNSGQPASFTVVAAGSGTISYQWSKDSTPISGATSATYSISTASAADAGSYSVYVSNAFGNVTSSSVMLTLNVPPDITGQPANQTVNAGQPVSFSVTATGTAPLSFQWAKGGSPISGATADTYSIGTTQGSDAGSYTVVVSNVAGDATSNAATLTVNTLPSISTQPAASQTVTAGNAVSFTVAASGPGPFTYQWFKDGVAVDGAVAATYTIYTPQASDAGSYTVEVSNGVGTVASGASVLTVNVPTLVSIAVTPANPAVNVGAAQLFTATGTFSDSSTRSLAGDWAARGSLGTTRSSATATLLGNGKVLVAGGGQSAGDSTPLASTELFNPVTGTFSAAASLTVPRKYHTATMLSNGKVLLTGGFNMSSGRLASAELYDPATGTFTATGSMATARYSHTATLLGNGKVLVAGGYINMGPPDFLDLTASAELYDPATGTFTATGSMPAARYSHTATLLSNGKVLVTGGSSSFGNNASANAALYDPAAGTFTATGSLTQARMWQTATLLGNGKVLIAGGYDGSSVLSSAELYDPATGTFSATGSMTLTRYLHTATQLNNGEVLIVGLGQYPYVNTELYDPASGTFHSGGSMTQTHVYLHTATLLADGTVLITGGGDTGNNPSTAVDLFTPAAAWSSGSPAVASVGADGAATGVGPGTSTITATLGAVSGNTVLTVNGITTPPSNQTVNVGQDASFTIAAAGIPTPTYQWQVSTDGGTNWGGLANGGTYSGVTLTTLTVGTNVEMGGYQYRCVVTIGATPITSTAATLTLNANFSLWQATYFTAGEISTPSISGPNAIYGQDGLPNLVKYALGLDPVVSATTSLPAVGVSGPNWFYTFTRPTGQTDITVTVEASGDLVNWSTANVTLTKTDTVGNVETWQATYPLASGANVFFRLKVTQP